MNDKTINSQIEIWSVYNAIALSVAFAIALSFNNLIALLIVFAISIISLLFINRRALFYSNPFFGVANSITFLRFAVIIFSFLFIEMNDTTLLFYFLAIAVLLDFFDGLAARYFNEASFFGQYFDMEIDAFFVLIMCSYYFLYVDFSWWILIPGILRYVFRLYTYFLPKENIKEEKKTYATVIAASFFVVLLIGLITTGWLQYLILLLGSLAILFSFIVGFFQYQKQ